MSLKYLNLTGLSTLVTDIKNWVTARIPTKTSEITNDSGFITGTSDCVHIAGSETVTGEKNHTANFNLTKSVPILRLRNTDVVIGSNGQQDLTASKNSFIAFKTSSDAYANAELANYAMGTYNRFRIVSRWYTSTSASNGIGIDLYTDANIKGLLPTENNKFNFGSASYQWKAVYSNAYYLGTTAFGDIVTHNASEFSVDGHTHSYLPLSGGTLTGNVIYKRSDATRGTAPSSNVAIQHCDTKDSANNRITLIETTYYTDKSSKIALFAYKTTNATGNNIGSIGIGCTTSGTVYTFAPTPAASDNSTQIATTAWVTAKGYLTSHQSVSNSAPTLAWGTTSTIGTIGGTALTVKMPANPNTNTTYSAGTGLSLSGTTFSVTSTAGTSTLAWNSEVTLGTVGGLAIKAKLPANPNTNTDTLMTQNVSTTNATYPVLLVATADATANQGAKTGIFAKSVKVNPSTNVISASGFSGPLTGNVTGNCSGTSANVTGTVAIANGGTGATTRLNAVKALTNENVGTSTQYFLTITQNWGKAGYCSVADAKTVLGLKSGAYADAYTHPTTAGNKHIPSGGSSGQILKYSSSGTAAWADPTFARKFATIHSESGSTYVYARTTWTPKEVSLTLTTQQPAFISIDITTSGTMLFKGTVSNCFIIAVHNAVGSQSNKQDSATYGALFTQTSSGRNRVQVLVWPYSSSVKISIAYVSGFSNIVNGDGLDSFSMGVYQ